MGSCSLPLQLRTYVPCMRLFDHNICHSCVCAQRYYKPLLLPVLVTRQSAQAATATTTAIVTAAGWEPPGIIIQNLNTGSSRFNYQDSTVGGGTAEQQQAVGRSWHRCGSSGSVTVVRVCLRQRQAATVQLPAGSLLECPRQQARQEDTFCCSRLQATTPTWLGTSAAPLSRG